MTNYKTEQEKQDKEFEEKWTDIMQWSDDYGDREAKGVSALQLKSYLLSRDSALLEAFKKDVGEMVEKNKVQKEATKVNTTGADYIFVYDLLSLLKDYNLPQEETENRCKRVFLFRENQRKSYFVHRLVAQEFIKNEDKKPFVNHKDGNKRNNSLKNLEWCTASENQKHAYKHLGMVNGHTSYRTAKLYPSETLRSRLIELGVPRYRHNLAELGEMLPFFIETENQILRLIQKKVKDVWCVRYEYQNKHSIRAVASHEQTEPDSRAKMLIYLLENKLIETNEKEN